MVCANVPGALSDAYGPEAMMHVASRAFIIRVVSQVAREWF
jgi:hypothetical protein